MKKMLYTIGYGNRKIEDFIQLLRIYQIQILVDVRSRPFSRFRPDFNRLTLEIQLMFSGIEYVFKGNELGGMPRNPNLQTNEVPDYNKIRNTEEYQNGLSYLENKIQTGNNIVIMCAELDFLKCHRYELVGADLVQRDYSVHHITKNGLITQYNGII